LTSIIYRNARLYALAMRLLYRGALDERNRALAERIEAGTRVVDLCCGPPLLFTSQLKRKHVRYLGIDLNPVFLAAIQKSGAEAMSLDLRDTPRLPRGDYVIMQGSLYHFLPDPAPIVERMLEAAGHRVILSEPIRNFSQSRLPGVAALAALSSDAGYGAQPNRFDEATLDRFFEAYSERIVESSLVARGREKLYVLRGATTS
jgi:SAM-dependent methyltransferase